MLSVPNTPFACEHVSNTVSVAFWVCLELVDVRARCHNCASPLLWFCATQLSFPVLCMRNHEGPGAKTPSTRDAYKAAGLFRVMLSITIPLLRKTDRRMLTKRKTDGIYLVPTPAPLCLHSTERHETTCSRQGGARTEESKKP